MGAPDATASEWGFSGPWVFVPDSFSAKNILLSFLSLPGVQSFAPQRRAASVRSRPANAGVLTPHLGGPTDTRIVLFFAPGCDAHQIPGDEGDRMRLDILKQLVMRFLDAAHIGCTLDRDMLERGVEGDVSTCDAAFIVSGMLLDEVLVWRLGHLLLRMLATKPLSVEDDGGNECLVRFSGFGFMYL